MPPRQRARAPNALIVFQLFGIRCVCLYRAEIPQWNPPVGGGQALTRPSTLGRLICVYDKFTFVVPSPTCVGETLGLTPDFTPRRTANDLRLQRRHLHSNHRWHSTRVRRRCNSTH